MERSEADGGRDDGVWGSARRIARDQYVHFVTLAHQHGDAADWPSFRLELVAALNAAWGLDTRWSHRTAAQNDWVADQRQRRALAALDRLRVRIDPAAAWSAFFDALWEARATIRADIDPPIVPTNGPDEARRLAGGRHGTPTTCRQGRLARPTRHVPQPRSRSLGRCAMRRPHR